MDLGEKKAYEDFETIRMTLEQTKVDYNGLYKILLTYGIVQSILCAFSIIMVLLLRNHIGYGIGVIPFIIDILAAVYMVFFYFKIYKSEKKISNKYYLSCISMWGIIAIMLPFISFAVRVVLMLVVPSEKEIILLPKLQEFDMLINIVLVSFCFIICSFIVNKKYLIVLSVIILYVFLILDILFYNTNISKIGTIVLTIFYYICITIGYIGLSYVLKWRNKNGYK